jgi:hypothetical protein
MMTSSHAQSSISWIADRLTHVDYFSPGGVGTIVLMAALFFVAICAFAPRTEIHQ